MAFILESVLCGLQVRNTETRETMDFQIDWDYPRLASMFGNHKVICDCGNTDGTVDCSHKTASAMINEATEWLYDNIGLEVDGRGTFDDYPNECWFEADSWL